METVACPDCDLLQQLPGAAARGQGALRALRSRPGDPVDRSPGPPAGPDRRRGHRLPDRQHGAADGAVGRRSPCEHDHRGGAYEMWVQGEQITAAIVAFCAVIAPGGYILFMLAVLLAVRRPPAPRWVGEMLRGAHAMRPWSMNEVMLLGILVALIKIAELATVEPGIGMYAMGALVVLFAAIMVTVDPHEIWKRVEWANAMGHPALVARRPARRPAMTAPPSPPPRPDSSPARRATCCRGPPTRPSPGTARAAAAELAWRRHHSIQVHVGPRHRRGDLLHPRQRPARAQHDGARLDGLRHHHGRGGPSLHHGIVAAGPHRADRQRDGPAREARRAQLSPDRGAARLAREQPRADPPLSPGGVHRPLVDAGRVRRYFHRRPRAAPAADVGGARSGRAVLRRGGGAHDDRRGVLRSAAHLGCQRALEEQHG